MSSTRETLRVCSAHDLFEGLGNPVEGVRLSVLQTVAAYPEVAVSYGPWEGEDLVTRLIGMARTDVSPLVRSTAVKVVANFKGPRVQGFLLDQVEATPDAELVFTLEPRLAVEPIAEIRETLLRFVDDPQRYGPQAIVAARLLAADDGLTAAQRLRLALITDVEVEVPPLESDTRAAWVGEIEGPLGTRAWAVAVAQGTAALRLWSCWDDLSDASRLRLIAWTEQAHPETARLSAPALLDERLSADVAVALLTGAVRAGLDVATLSPETVVWLLAHDEERVRVAAYQAGLGTADALLAFVRDSRNGAHARSHVLTLYARRDLEGGTDALLLALDDDDWRVRGAAADGLAARGEVALERVSPLLHSTSERVRAAAARVVAGVRGDDALMRMLDQGASPSTA